MNAREPSPAVVWLEDRFDAAVALRRTVKAGGWQARAAVEAWLFTMPEGRSETLAPWEAYWLFGEPADAGLDARGTAA